MRLFGQLTKNQAIEKFNLDPSMLKNKFVKIYSIAAEGVSTPNILGFNNKPLVWTKDKITELYNSIKTGEPVFYNHTTTNSHDNRQPIGEIVGKSLDTIDNKQVITAAVAFSSPNNYDAISIESTIEFEDAGKNYIVKRILDFTAAAVASLREFVPAFKNAVQVAEFQFFYEPNELNKRGKVMTLDEVKNLIQQNKWKPTDLFSTSQLIGKIRFENNQFVYDIEDSDPKLGKIIEKYFVTNANNITSELNNEINKIKPVLEEYNKLKLETNKKFAESKVLEYATEHKLSESAKKFVLSALKEYNPEQDMKEFINSKLELYKSLVDAGLINEAKQTTPPKPAKQEQDEKPSSFEEILDSVQESKNE